MGFTRTGTAGFAPLCLAMALAAAAAEPPEPVTAAAPADPAVSEEAERALQFRSGVWQVYALGEALGRDDRNRSVMDDLRAWVLPAASDRPAEVGPRLKRLELVAIYWNRRPSLRQQRSLWEQRLTLAPQPVQQASRARIDVAEKAMFEAYAPDREPSALNDAMDALLRAYNRERLTLVAGVTDADRGSSGADRVLPCPPNLSAAPKSGNQPIATTSHPDVGRFYPLQARRDLLTGRVFVTITVDANGCMQHAEISRSSGVPALDDAALQVVEYSGFSPAYQAGSPIESRAVLPVSFQLDADPKNAKSTAQDAADHLRRGNDLMNQRDFDAAVSELDRAIELEPGSALAYADRGLAHLWKLDFAQARNDLATAEFLDPRSAVMLRGRGALALAEGDCAAAAGLLGRAVEREPSHDFAYRWRARAYECLGRYPEALADLDQALKAAPKLLDLYRGRAQLLQALGRNEEALEQAHALVAEHPDDSEAFLVAGEILGEMGRQAESMSAYDRAVELSPNERAYLRRAHGRDPSDLAGRRSDIESALKLNASSAMAVAELTWLDIEAHGNPTAAAALGPAPQAHQGGYLWPLRAGVLAWMRQERTQAQEQFAEAMRGADAGQLNNICYELAAYDIALDTALRACQRAIDQDPHEGAVLDSLGFVLLKLHRYRESTDAFERALRVRPLSADSLYGRGIALRHLGPRRAADESIRTALTLDATVRRRYQEFGIAP